MWYELGGIGEEETWLLPGIHCETKGSWNGFSGFKKMQEACLTALTLISAVPVDGEAMPKCDANLGQN